MRRAREIWVQIVGQFNRSGLTQEAFADERGIPVATLRSWIYRLRRQEDEEDAPFLPVHVVASAAPKARDGGGVVGAIELEGRRLFELHPGRPGSAPPGLPESGRTAGSAFHVNCRADCIHRLAG